MMPARRSQNWLPGIFNDFFGNEWVEKTNTASPAINIIESDNDYKVEVAAPGMTKDDFSIKIDPENQLIVSMEKKTENDEKDKKGKYLRREFSYSRFQQIMVLPENVEVDRDESGELYYIYHAYTDEVPGEQNKDIYFRRDEIFHVPGLAEKINQKII